MLNECRTAAAAAPSVHHSSFIIQRSPRAFTLTELLIVMALIVLIIAIAVPAFRAITGSRSIDAGDNLVSAMVSRARAEAMEKNRLAGVAFFLDDTTGRTGMALVVQSSQRGSLTPEPGGLEQYKAWKERQESPDPNNPNAGPPTQYKMGDVVVALVEMNPPENGKRGTKLFVCIQDHTSSNSTKPPNTTYWGTLNDAEIDTLVGYEYQLLPPGIGAQTINDPDPDPAFPAPATGRDRYLRSGLILFDGNGALAHRKYIVGVPADITLPVNQRDPTHLFYLMNFDTRAGGLATTPVGAASAYPHYSQLGVVIYDLELWKNAGGTEDDPLNDNVAYTTPAYKEQAEEQWLDSNSLSLMINRYNGTLIRGE